MNTGPILTVAPPDSNSPADEAPRLSTRKLRIASESTSVFLAQVMGLAFGVANNFFVAWMLGPQGKGLIYLIQFTASSAVIFLNFGLGPSAIYHLGRDRNCSEADISSVLLWPSVLLGTIPVVFLGILWPWLGSAAINKFGAPYLLIALGAVPAMVLTWNVSYLSLAKGRLTTYNLLRVAPPALFLLGLLLPLAFAQLRAGLWVASAWAFGVAAAAVYAVFHARGAGGVFDTRRKTVLRNAFRFGWLSHIGAVTQYLQHRVDMVLISTLRPMADVGIYSVAVAGSELLWYIPHTVSTVLMPHVAMSRDEEADRMTSAFCRVIVGVNMVLALTLALFSTVLIHWLLPSFRSSIPALWLLLPGTVAASVFKVLSSDLNGRGKPLETFRPAAISLVACIIAGLTIIPKLGVNGAALVTSGGYILNTFLYIRTYSRVTSVAKAELLFPRRTDFASLLDMVRSVFARVSE